MEKYEGIWTGTYTGNEEGTWKVHIDENGTSGGVMQPSDSENQSFTFSGSVNEDGELAMTAFVFGRVATYDAYLTETTLSGNWSDEEGNFTGTWSGTKRVKEDRFPYGPLLNP